MPVTCPWRPQTKAKLPLTLKTSTRRGIKASFPSALQAQRPDRLEAKRVEGELTGTHGPLGGRRADPGRHETEPNVPCLWSGLSGSC